ncbi:MAG: hypothetical protein HYV09_21375 [Deltaproteobacteria bacterium]|nr:hypothetical protein [Deltaproteobacteria bacterium]
MRAIAVFPLLVVLGSLASLACSGAASTDAQPAADPGSAEETAPRPEEDTAPPSPPSPEGEKDAAPPPPFCDAATGVYTATPAAHDVLFLFDRSGSMHAKIASGTTRWQAAQKALSSLFDAVSPTTRAGLDMFPRGDKPITCCWIDPATNYTDCNCASGELPTGAKRCASTTYNPALVPVAPLNDAQKATMRATIAGSDAEFYWGTPMKAALQGAIQKQAMLDLDASRSVVLITDGEPTSCNATDDDIDSVVSVAKAGTELAKPVSTYVVGVIDGKLAGNAANLSKVALAGGTKRAAGCEATSSCFYAVDAKSFEADITKAFKDIEMKAFACTFDVPKLASGAPDFDKVNVSLKKADGTSATVARDPARADGWDFVEGSAKVKLYGAACTAVKADTSTKVEIVLGCKTIEK